MSAGKTYLCDLTIGRIAKKMVLPHAAEVMSVSADAKLVALATGDDVEIRNVRNWKVRNRIKMESLRALFINVLAFSPDSRRLLIGLRDVKNGIELYNAATGRKIWTADGDQESDVAWSPDAKSVAVNMRHDLYLFRARDGKAIKKFASDESPVRFSSNGKQLFFSNKSTLVICDAASGKVVRKVGISNVLPCVISRDVRWLAHVTEDGSTVQFRAINFQ